MKEQKMMIYSVVAILVIFMLVMFLKMEPKVKTTEEKNLAGQAYRVDFIERYAFEESEICGVTCPSGFNAVLEDNCRVADKNCEGTVLCGRFVNGSQVNETYGWCDWTQMASPK